MLTFMSIDGKNGVVKSFPLVHQKLFFMQTLCLDAGLISLYSRSLLEFIDPRHA